MWLWFAFLLITVVALVVWVCIVLSASDSSSSSSSSCCSFSVSCSNMVNVGVTPAGLAACGNYVYVANNNNYGLTGSDSVTVIKLSDGCCAKPITTIFDDSFNQPYTITIGFGNAYVTNSAGTTVTIIDLSTNTVSGIITGFDGPSGFTIVKKKKRAYVNNYGSAAGVGSGNGTTIRMVDLTTNLITGAAITVDQAPAALVNDGSFVYVINYVDGNPGTGTLQMIDVDSDLVVQTITGFSGPFGIALKGCKAYVTNFGSNNFWPYGTTVSVVDIRDSFAIVDTIEDVGIQPSGIVIVENTAYVTTYNTLYASPGFNDLTAGQGLVVAIDLKHNKIIGSAELGQSPANIIKVGHKTLLATNFISNTLSILQIHH